MFPSHISNNEGLHQWHTGSQSSLNVHVAMLSSLLLLLLLLACAISFPSKPWKIFLKQIEPHPHREFPYHRARSLNGKVPYDTACGCTKQS